MKVIKAILGLGILLVSNQGFASGWVKSPDQFYLKISNSQSDAKKSNLLNLPIEETEMATSIYGELGLDLPWKSQMTIFSSRKAILRQEQNETKDEFLSASLSDTQISLKSEILDLSDYIESPITFLVAGAFGLNLPTTPSKFSLGNEAKRINDVPAGKEYLLGTIDKGTSGYLLALGASAYFQGVWLNFGFDYLSDQKSRWSDTKINAALGVGLPYNSWLQVSYSTLNSKIDNAILATPQVEPLKDESSQISVGLGITVWNGLALEGDMTQGKNEKGVWSDWQTYTIGVSYRTI